MLELEEDNTNNDPNSGTVPTEKNPEEIEKILEKIAEERTEKELKEMELENKNQPDDEDSVNEEGERTIYNNIPAPPAGNYDNVESVKEAIQEFARAHGYGILVKRSVPGKSVHFKCVRSVISQFFFILLLLLTDIKSTLK